MTLEYKQDSAANQKILDILGELQSIILMKIFKDYLIYSVVSPWDRRRINENYTYNLVT